MSHTDWTLLAKYLEGNCTPRERETVEQWASADSANHVELDELRRTWSRAAQLPTTRRIDAMWGDLAQRIASAESPRPHRASSPRGLRVIAGTQRANRIYRIAGLAAAAAILVSVVSLSLTSRPKDNAPVAEAPKPMREYVTTRGQKATIHLADGTKLTLAADSRLRVPHDFGATARELILEGEAVFDVVHDEAKPFRVRTRNAMTEDLGTRFVMRDYATDSVLRVVVMEGAVAMEGVVLEPGGIGSVSRGGRVVSGTTRNPERFASWANGVLSYERTPLARVVADIGRWYDLDVRLPTRPLRIATVTAELPVRSPSEMLRLLALAVDARVERNGNVIHLVPKS